MDWAIPKDDTYFRAALAKTPEGFELDHLAYALGHCSKFRTAVDGGAHIGTWSVALAQRFQKVLSFEPAPDTYDCLLRNTNAAYNVSTYNVALGRTGGRVTITEDNTRIGNSGSRFIGMSGTRVASVTVVPIDQINIPDLDFLKLDVEGYEPLALEGAIETILRCRPAIMVECKEFSPPRNGGVAATRQVLANLGYAEVGGIRNDRVYLPA